MKLDKKRTLGIIKAALKEDIGEGDVTTVSTIPRLESVKASIMVNEDCIVCGMDVAEWIINSVDFSVRFKPQVNDGEHVCKGKEIIFLEGHARGILSTERTMLNFLSFLSGISTKTGEFVKKVEKYGSKIYDTRKTLPLLRYLEKYAVHTGGGYNHRIGLWDQVLIKENHLHIMKGEERKKPVSSVRKKVTKNIKIEVEVENIKEFKSMLAEKPNIIMLDNMSAADVKTCVDLRNEKSLKEKVLLEASGGIDSENVEEYAKTGIDRISVGSLTSSIKSIDMSLELIA